MQNPFRHRPQDDFGRREEYGDDRSWEARDRRHDEGRSWSEGDGGRTAEAYRDQGRSYGQYSRGDRDFPGQRSWDEGQGQDQARYGGQRPSPGASYDQYGYGARSSPGYAGPTYGQSGYGDRYARQDRGQGDYGRQDPDRARAWSGGRDHDYQGQGYAPGAQIWETRGSDYYGARGARQQDFEPDYLHWREQQLSNFDKDYSTWRDERRQKFSSDFDTWRQNRAANPIVGDVSDGGTGDASELKKR